MTLLHHRDTPSQEEALIKEARRLRRRRWLLGSTLTALAAGAAVAGFSTASRPPDPPHRQPRGGGLQTPGYSAPSAHPFLATHALDLIQPAALAILPDGDLLILDSSRDQILRLTPKGVLSVFAGDGRIGFSGDGSPARNAELDLPDGTPASLALTPDGRVDFLDDGGCRVRQVSPAGTIHTILQLPPTRLRPSGTACPITALAVSPTGDLYLAAGSAIERVAARRHLLRVVGSRGPYAHAETTVTASHLAFFPSALAFNPAGDLFIWNQSPKLIFELTPAGRLTALNATIYASQLTTAPDGDVLAGTQDGAVQIVTPQGIRAFYDVAPSKVPDLHWGRDRGFQEDGIAVAASGTVYVDNAQGNGYGAGTVLVRISPDKHATLVPIHTPLAATLPGLDASGFPASVYPASRPSSGAALASCPSDTGLEPFTAQAVNTAKRIARSYMAGSFASDIAVTDRSWWTADFNALASGSVGGSHSVAGERPAAQTPAAAGIQRACGAQLAHDSIAVSIRPSPESDLTGTLYLLDRRGHPLVYDLR